MAKKTLLITSMGGCGSNNLVETIRHFAPGHYKIIGTHYNPLELVKAEVDQSFLVPKVVDEEAFIEAHLTIIREQGVDALIINSDKEVAIFSKYKSQLPCRVLLPDSDIVNSIQDKYTFNRILAKHDCRTVMNVPVDPVQGVVHALKVMGFKSGEKFWLRSRGGSGSQGACWFYTAEQAEKWMSLLIDIKGMSADEFVVAPFLPGRDFAVVTVWDCGQLILAKVVERLEYFMGSVLLSGMGSTPSVSKSVCDLEPIKTSEVAITAIYSEYGQQPHGYYHSDLKCDAEGNPYVTEINIGRFPMINPHFDRIGRYRPTLYYLDLLFDRDIVAPDVVYDFDPDKYILRSINQKTLFIDAAELQRFPAVLGAPTEVL